MISFLDWSIYCKPPPCIISALMMYFSIPSFSVPLIWSCIACGHMFSARCCFRFWLADSDRVLCSHLPLCFSSHLHPLISFWGWHINSLRPTRKQIAPSHPAQTPLSNPKSMGQISQQLKTVAPPTCLSCWRDTSYSSMFDVLMWSIPYSCTVDNGDSCKFVYYN